MFMTVEIGSLTPSPYWWKLTILILTSLDNNQTEHPKQLDTSEGRSSTLELYLPDPLKPKQVNPLGLGLLPLILLC